MTTRICFVLPSAGRGAARHSDATAEVIERLRARGAIVDVLLPDDGPIDIAELRPAHDLYVLKSRTPVALAVAAVLDARGARAVNPYRASAIARDKIASTAILAAAGIKVPASFATGEPARLVAAAPSTALWLKPYRGSRGAGVTRLPLAQARSLPAPRDVDGLPLPAFAQVDVPTTGADLKVYVVGERLWGVSRVFPARTPAEKAGIPAIVSGSVRDAALRCGQVLGLELYGVDVVGAGADRAIVDVNAYPGYKGAAGAAAAIADHLLARARGRLVAGALG